MLGYLRIIVRYLTFIFGEMEINYVTGICYMIEPPHLRLVRDEAPLSGRDSGQTRPPNILL